MRGPFFMPERKFWAFFYCNLVQGGVILSYKWRKVVDDGIKWRTRWVKVVILPKPGKYLFTDRGVFYVHGRIQSHS